MSSRIIMSAILLSAGTLAGPVIGDEGPPTSVALVKIITALPRAVSAEIVLSGDIQVEVLSKIAFRAT